MGVESRIDIIGGYNAQEWNGYNNLFAERIVSMQLSKMGSDFLDAWDEKSRPLKDFHVEYYKDDGETVIDGTTKDPYGSYYQVLGVKDALKLVNAERDIIKSRGERPYRRLEMLYNTLKSFKSGWDNRDIYVVHSCY